MRLCIHRAQLQYFGLLNDAQQGADQIVQETDCVRLYLVQNLLLWRGVHCQVKNSICKAIVRKRDGQRFSYDYLKLRTEQ